KRVTRTARFCCASTGTGTLFSWPWKLSRSKPHRISKRSAPFLAEPTPELQSALRQRISTWRNPLLHDTEDDLWLMEHVLGGRCYTWRYCWQKRTRRHCTVVEDARRGRFWHIRGFRRCPASGI